MNEQHLETQIKKIRELEAETKRLEKEAEEIMSALGVTKEEIDLLFSDPSQLTQQEHEIVQKERALFEMSFQQRTERFRTVEGLKKKYQDLHLSRHWIPVR